MTLMRELQGPRIPREEGSRRRRPIGWIAAGLIALLLLALLIPFACQALTGNLTLREALPARRRTPARRPRTTVREEPEVEVALVLH